MYKILQALVLCFISNIAFSQAVIYVSANGNDAWSGSSKTSTGNNGPLRTIEAAFKCVPVYLQQHPSTDSITINIASGEYLIDKTINLGPSFNNNGKCKIIIAGAGSLQTKIIGSKAVSPSGASQAITALTGDNTKRHLFFNNGNIFQSAVFPQNGYYYFTGLKVIKTSNPSKDVQEYAADSSVNAGLFDNLVQLKQKGQFLGINMYANWIFGSRKIDSFDVARKKIYTSGISLPEGARFSKDDRFQIINPNQFSTFKDGKVVKTVSGSSNLSGTVYIPVTDTIFFFNGSNVQPVSNIQFKNLAFQYFDYEKTGEVLAEQNAANSSSAILLINASNISFSSCVFKNIAQNVFWFKAGCNNSNISNCRFEANGESAIRIGDHGFWRHKDDYAKVINSKIVINADTVNNCDLINYGAGGIIALNGSDISITNNNVGNLTHNGIAIGWGWGTMFNVASNFKVASNTVHDIGKNLMNDLAGIYTTGPLDGSVIEKNDISNITHYTYGAIGIYLDEGAANCTVENNVTYNTQKSGFMLNNGHDVSITHNIFSKSGDATVIYAHFKNKNSTMKFKDNVVNNDKNKPLTRGLNLTGIESDGNVFWDDVARENTLIQAGVGANNKPAANKPNDNNSVIKNPGFKANQKVTFNGINSNVKSFLSKRNNN